MRTHEITSKTSGKVYEVRKMRTAPNFLPVYCYRRVGDLDWRSLSADTLAEARERLNA
jgi:hypothetical protein